MKTKLKMLLVERMRKSFANDAIAYVEDRFKGKLALNAGKYGIGIVLGIEAKDSMLKFRIVNAEGKKYSVNCDIDAAAEFGVKLSEKSPDASNPLLAFAGVEQVMLMRGVTVITAGPVTEAIFEKFYELLAVEEEDVAKDDQEVPCDCPECNPQAEPTEQSDEEAFKEFVRFIIGRD